MVAAIADDTSRESRRAQDAILRRNNDTIAAAPRYKHAPNWLKIALNSQR